MRLIPSAFLGEEVGQVHDAGVAEHQPRREGASEIDLVTEGPGQLRLIELENEVTNEADMCGLPDGVQARRNDTERTRELVHGRLTGQTCGANLQTSSHFFEHG